MSKPEALNDTQDAPATPAEGHAQGPVKKERFLQEMEPGQPVSDLFVLIAAQRREAASGPFWSLGLQDATGKADAVIWSPESERHTELNPGQIVLVEGDMGLFRGKKQIKVRRLTVLDPAQGEADMAGLTPESRERPEDMLARLEELCRKNLHYPPWRKLAFGILADDEIRYRMIESSGGKAMHHAYRGGLLEHTLSVAGLVLSICGHYPELDKEILLLAAVLHDLGKAWELSPGPAVDYTSEGRLLGHIQLGLEILRPWLEESKADPELVLHLKHILISHHGEYEYGSPKRPKTAEAMVMHYADNLDAKMNQMACSFPEDAEEDDSVWSPYVRGLDRFLFRPVPTPGRVARKKKKEAEANQCALPLGK